MDMEKQRIIKITLVSLCSFFLLQFSRATISDKIGVNYGRQGTNLPSAARSIELLQTMKAGRVKLYDADPETLQLLSGTKLDVAVTVGNDAISGLASSEEIADQWVGDHVLAHYPATRIRYILVGNEVLSYGSTYQDTQLMQDLVPAMRRIRNSIKAQGIHNIKVGTPLAMDVMGSTSPPSSGSFKPEVEDVMRPLLKFLSGTKSFLFLNVYPYQQWSENPDTATLDFALFREENGNQTYTDPDSGLTYTNLLDQMLDSVVFAMAKLGYNDVNLAISETGWPHDGDASEAGANRENAAAYNANLIRKMTAAPAEGTPARPRVVIPTFIFSLFDEDQKEGPESERHWGLLNADGSPVYEVDLTGKAYKN